MSKVASKAIGILVLSLCVGTAAYAGQWQPNSHFGFQGPHQFTVVTPPAAAPEIDPASAFSGLTLLLGGLAVVRGRRAKK